MKYSKTIMLVLTACLVVCISLAQAAIVVRDIQVTDLGTLPGGTASSARDINDAGTIVGSSETASGEIHAFVMPSGVMLDIGTLPGGDFSRASGINELDQVVGGSNTYNPLTSALVLHGFEWEAGLITDLGAFPPEDDINSESNAFAINNSGLIAGIVDLAGVVWDLNGVPNYPPFPPNVRITDPGPFAPARTLDINNASQAAGTLTFDAVGFRWQAGVVEPLVPLMSGVVDDDAYAINELGEIVGVGALAPPLHYHAAYWPDPDTVQDLGTLGGTNSEARDISNDSKIVGSSETDTGDTLAFVWHADFGMVPLGTLGGANSRAYAINSFGRIVGESETATGEVHAALWDVTFATLVQIDIKPGSSTNPLNPFQRGVIPVAVLGSETFDATSINAATLAFGTAGAAPAHKNGGHLTDVNDDGFVDLLSHYRVADTGIVTGDDEACVNGQLFDGSFFQGCDSIHTVPKEKK